MSCVALSSSANEAPIIGRATYICLFCARKCHRAAARSLLLCRYYSIFFLPLQRIVLSLTRTWGAKMQLARGSRRCSVGENQSPFTKHNLTALEDSQSFQRDTYNPLQTRKCMYGRPGSQSLLCIVCFCPSGSPPYLEKVSQNPFLYMGSKDQSEITLEVVWSLTCARHQLL